MRDDIIDLDIQYPVVVVCCGSPSESHDTALPIVLSNKKKENATVLVLDAPREVLRNTKVIPVLQR